MANNLDLIAGLEWPDVPWSYSALTQFENCAMNYGAVNVRKAYGFQSSPQMEEGNRVHKLLEKYVTFSDPLPPGLAHIGGVIDKMIAGAAQVQGEQSIDLTPKLEVVRVHNMDAKFRVKIDLTVLRHNDQSIITDYKTSSEPREDFEQLELCAMAHMIANPEVKRCHCYYLYTKHKPRKTVIDNTELPKIVTSYIPRLQRLKHARDTNTFPATPYYGCRWCPVVTCQHNPKFH